MSRYPDTDPVCTSRAANAAIATVVEGRKRDLGGFSVERLLPSPACRRVGPVVFFDHMGPATLAAGQGVDVRPHPHIGLATVTYLFEGGIVHRDSLGFVQPIEPGAINWMTAGGGIAHSERTPPALRATGSRLHGIQLWVALPKAHEESAPDFRHHPAAHFPSVELDGVRLRVLVGSAFGSTSPVRTLSPMIYVDAHVDRAATLRLPATDDERAAFVAAGSVGCAGEQFSSGRLVVLAPNAEIELVADSDARVLLLGGAPLDGDRHLWWNFVSSSRDRIEQAKRDWSEGRFAPVPGETEFIALPER
jgi:redox-sensitive bicupin YhaK (pirin superfamily)